MARVSAAANLFSYEIEHNLSSLLTELYGLHGMIASPTAPPTMPSIYRTPSGKRALHRASARWGVRFNDILAQPYLGRRTKYMLLWADRLAQAGLLTPEVEDLLEYWHHYQWRCQPFRGVRLYTGRDPRLQGKAVVLRTIGRNTDAAAWIFPAKTWERTRRWMTKDGEHSRTTYHTTPPRDMKPGLLGGRSKVTVPIPLNPEFMQMAQDHYGADEMARRLGGTPD